MTGGTGISFEGTAFDPITALPIGTAIIDGNTANENDGAGIGVADGGGHLVSNNRAYHNAEIGIAAEGNRDGGGNRPPATAPRPVPVRSRRSAPAWSARPARSRRSPGIDLTAPETSILSNPANPTPATTATFAFTATDLRDDGSLGTPVTGMVFECRLDPPPDPPEEPVEPETEPPHPNDPPDVYRAGRGRRLDGVHQPDRRTASSSPATTSSRCGRWTRRRRLISLTQRSPIRTASTRT